MKKAVSVGGILVRRVGNKTEILLMRYPNTLDLGFLKGHIEGDETIEETALREVSEEAGLKNLKIIKKIGQYARPAVEKNGERVFKDIHIFLMETDNLDHQPSEEEYGWFEYDEAIKKMAFKKEAEFLRQHKMNILNPEVQISEAHFPAA